MYEYSNIEQFLTFKGMSERYILDNSLFYTQNKIDLQIIYVLMLHWYIVRTLDKVNNLQVNKIKIPDYHISERINSL